jgi:hypothetical protein
MRLLPRGKATTRSENDGAGTRVTQPLKPADRIAAFRAVVEEQRHAMIDGVIVPFSSAIQVVAVYDALKPDNQALFASWPAPKMVAIAFKLGKNGALGGRESETRREPGVAESEKTNPAA